MNPVALSAACRLGKRSSLIIGPYALVAVMYCSTSAFGQTASNAQPGAPTDPLSISQGGNLIRPGDLPGLVGASLQQTGNRMTSADKAQIIVAGTVTDSNGSRSAQIVVQSPGYLAYREGARSITFDGTSVQSKAGQLSSDDQRVFESLLADFPDMIFLQIATGGSLRRIGSHFRTDDGKAKGYTGPYWTVFAFSPKNRPGLTRGKGLQQEIFIAIDEQTGLIADVRMVVTSQGSQEVNQTQFSNWAQQNGQWFPGNIVRLENGNQVLSFQTLSAVTGPAADPATFKP
jgi:hypothetical protein